jgi:hypothetical protein
VAKLITYDVSNVEEQEGSTGVKVKPGVKVAKIMVCEQRTQKTDGSPANDIRLGMSVGPEYDWVWTYIGLGEASDWKLKEFIKAVGLKDKGKMDPDKMKGKILRVKINSGEYDGEYSPRVGKLFPAQPGDEVGGVSEMSTNGASGPDEDDLNEPAVGEAEEFVPTREDPDDEEVGTYDEWDEVDLLGEVEDRGLTMPGGRGTKKVKAIKALRADDEAASEEPEEEEESDDDDTPDTDDYETWTVEDLTTEWGEREMGDLPNIRGRNREERLKTAIIEQLRKDDTDNPFEG